MSETTQLFSILEASKWASGYIGENVIIYKTAA
jgi:hypothetical protein